jgi:pyruvate dehydrogenase E2 component (dihydrolipoamide acetyltransferase)
MATDVIMPKVDMVMDEGTIVHWYKAEGDEVKAGEPLFDIETDKATMVIEAPGSGILSQITAPVDSTVPVATVIARILEPGEVGDQGSGIRDQGSEQVESVALATPATPQSVTVASRTPNTQHPAPDPRPRATPIARKLAREHAIDLATIPGSGPRGRVGKQDVLQALETTHSVEDHAGNGRQPGRESSTMTQAPSAAAAATTHESLTRASESSSAAGGRLIPLAGVRRIIAQRMAISATIPQFTLSIDVDMSAATQLRERLAYRPSFTAVIARVVASLLPRHPSLNASFRDDGIWLHEAVQLGIALDSGGDLLVPVIRDANRRTLRELHESLTDLRRKAEAKQLTPSELQGSTFSISNLGMFGIDRFTALINPPEAAILAVGSIVQQPVASSADDSWTWQPTMTITLSADHRVTDGATAARFLQDMRAALEEPYLLL